MTLLARLGDKVMNLDTLREIAQIVIDDHMAKGPCLFEQNAANNIALAVFDSLIFTQDVVIDRMVEAVKAAEIYCPHEEVDRRAEYGLA